MALGALDEHIAQALITQRELEAALPALRELPGPLPVEHLSVSSINMFLKCPEKWRRRYVLHEYEPPSGNMILGGAVGAAEAQHYARVIETGEGLDLEQVEDEFSSQWDNRVEREAQVDWGSEKPGELKDQGVQALGAYHTLIVPEVVPTSVERQFRLSWEGIDWQLTGYLDLEEADGAVSDLKVKSKKLGQPDADSDLQPSAYLTARRAEGNPAPEFRFHTMVRVKRPYAEIVTTGRTDQQLDAFINRVFMVATDIARRMEYDGGEQMWNGAVPGSWWCSERYCGYWPTCRFGGLR